jgi:hypothetical protein
MLAHRAFGICFSRINHFLQVEQTSRSLFETATKPLVMAGYPNTLEAEADYLFPALFIKKQTPELMHPESVVLDLVAGAS